MPIIIIPIYDVLFYYRLKDSNSLMSLEEARQQSETVFNDQTQLSFAMRVGFVTLAGRCIVQPTFNAVRFDRLLSTDTNSLEVFYWTIRINISKFQCPTPT